MATITAGDGAKLFATDHGGAGNPIVLVHCWPLDSSVFDHQVKALTAAGHRVITYDRRGFGQSDHPATGYDYDTLASDLGAVIETFNLENVALVGFSMGGGEVVRYLSHPQRASVRSVALLAAVTPYLLQTGDNPDGGLPPHQLDEITQALTADAAEFFDGFMRFFYSAGEDLNVSEDIINQARKLAEQASPQAVIDGATAWGSTDFREDVANIAVPTLIIHGDKDNAVPVEVSGQRCRDMITGSEFHTVANGPHGLTHSHPEEISQVLVDWAAKH